MSRIFNFSAGPATLPEAVLRQAQEELLDWRGTGTSVMEVSHRDKPFMKVAAEAEADLRTLMNIPSNYKVLFMQGGATAQFSIVAQNLMRGSRPADYVVTGEWSQKAAKIAKGIVPVHVAASTAEGGFVTVPKASDYQWSKDAAFVHLATNETIHGVQFHALPDTGDVPLVADASSDFACRPVDVARYGLIYAGAQKNIGPSGITLVIVRDDLMGQAAPGTFAVHDYAQVAANDSMLNTPPTFAWYLCGLVFKHMLQEGGLTAIAERNAQKAQRLYDYLDGQDFYGTKVQKADRSLMNVPFFLPNPEQNDAAFLQGAIAAGLNGLKGHRILGGMRASIYNAMPLAGVEALIAYMQEFARTRG